MNVPNNVAAALLVGIMSLPLGAADIPTALDPSAVPRVPVPKSPYIAVVYKFADTMLEKGRDTFGPQKTGLFLSALDRATLAPLTDLPTPPSGVQSGRVVQRDGILIGANPQHDENPLRLLYCLSELTTKPVYREAADVELKWLLEKGASPMGQFAWDVIKDEPIASDGGGSRPWMLWDRCFDLAPEPGKQFALALKDENGARNAGFRVRAWAVAYARTKDEKLLNLIAALIERFEKEPFAKDDSPAAILSFAIDCAGAAHRLPEPASSRLRTLARRADDAFCALPHDLKTKSGFASVGDSQTPLWVARSGGVTTAQIGMMCVSRYENDGQIKYRELIHAAADAYLKSQPAENDDVWPATFGHVISLQLAAWRSTARQVYFDRAHDLGDAALAKFFDNSPLPRASLKTGHYESITGAGTLALALLELHLQVLHITAVRYPPNTIDR